MPAPLHPQQQPGQGPRQQSQWPGPRPQPPLAGPPVQMPPPRPVMPPPMAAPPPGVWPGRPPQARFQHGPIPPGPPAWGPPPQYAPYPPKKNNGPLLAGVLFAVAILGIAVIGVVAATGTPNRASDAGYSGYSTYSYTAPTTTTTTATTSGGRASTSRPATASATSSKQAGPKAVIKLGDNPIHKAGLGAFDIDGCSLPGMDYSAAGQDSFLRAALPCVENMWKPSFTKANLPYQPVELVIVTSTITNPCGQMGPDRTAMYCDGTIYWTANYYAGEQGSNNPNHPGKYLGQLAHEYGHHIQWLSGILRASGEAQYDKGGWDTPAGLDLNRRKELQATCFGGMTLAPLSHGAIPRDVIDVALRDASTRGDYPVYPNRDHGAPERNAAWVMNGFTNNETSACNTWLSDEQSVS